MCYNGKCFFSYQSAGAILLPESIMEDRKINASCQQMFLIYNDMAILIFLFQISDISSDIYTNQITHKKLFSWL